MVAILKWRWCIWSIKPTNQRKCLVSIESAIRLMFSFGMFIIALLSLVVLIINSTKNNPLNFDQLGLLRKV
ncbi:putative holin-like toxin [Leuconostoc gelidum]